MHRHKEEEQEQRSCGHKAVQEVNIVELETAKILSDKITQVVNRQE